MNSVGIVWHYSTRSTGGKRYRNCIFAWEEEAEAIDSRARSRQMNRSTNGANSFGPERPDSPITRPSTASPTRPGTASPSRAGSTPQRPGSSYSIGMIVPESSIVDDLPDMGVNALHQSLTEGSWNRPQSATVRRQMHLNHSNIADKMTLQEEKSRRRHGWHVEEAELDIVHVMTYMRQRLTNSSVFLVEFFRDADASRRGYITTAHFMRGLDNVRCFNDMSNAERKLLIKMFSEQRPQQFKDQTFNYAAFCEILQPCNDSRISMTPAYIRQEELDNFNPDMSGDSPYAIQPLSREGDVRAAYLTRKLQHKIISTRVSARELLGDYDPHLNGGTVGWMKKTSKHTQFLCNVPGCISRSQYMRGMVRLAGDLGLTEEDMNLLYTKYERNGAFNYYAFCKDMDNPVIASASESGSPGARNFQTPLQSAQTGGNGNRHL